MASCMRLRIYSWWSTYEKIGKSSLIKADPCNCKVLYAPTTYLRVLPTSTIVVTSSLRNCHGLHMRMHLQRDGKRSLKDGRRGYGSKWRPKPWEDSMSLAYKFTQLYTCYAWMKAIVVCAAPNAWSLQRRFSLTAFAAQCMYWLVMYILLIIYHTSTFVAWLSCRGWSYCSWIDPLTWILMLISSMN
jgi:hypothetical protein